MAANPVRPESVEARPSHPGEVPDIRVDSDAFEACPQARYYLGAPSTPAEALAVRQLRARVYIDEMHFLGEEHRDPDGGESDSDDGRSVHFMVMENMGSGEQPRIVGTARLVVKRGPNDPLPVERLFPDGFVEHTPSGDIPRPAPESAAEASRLIARHPNRNTQRAINVALMRAMTMWAVNNTRQPIYGVLETPLQTIIERMRFPFHEVAKPRMIPEYNTVNSAIAIDPFGVLRAGRADEHSQVANQEFFRDAALHGGVGYFDAGFRPILTSAVVAREDMPVAPATSAELTERNLGFFTRHEQAILGAARIAIAGCGGDGGALAVQLARLGVGAQGGEIRLADPDVFDASNINRQEGATQETIGRNKAEVIAEIIRGLNPDIRVVVYSEGVTPANYEEFVDGTSLLIDESDFTVAAVGVALARAARQRRIPNLQVMNIGFGAQVTSYDAEGHYTFEHRLGISEDTPLEEVAHMRIPVSRWLADLPRYANAHTFDAVTRGGKPAPSVATGVAIAAGIAAPQAIMHLLQGENRRGRPIFAPHVLSVDAMTGRSRVIRHPRLNLLRTYIGMRIRTIFHRVPETSY